MSVLQVCAVPDALHRVRVDLLVVGFREDERPLRGSAGLVDWRLCGALSRLIAAQRTRGARGEAVLMPAGGGLQAERVLALGLGPAGRRDESARRECVREAIQRAVALRPASLALPVPFAGGTDDERGLAGLLEAASEAWRAGGAPDPGAELMLVGRPGRRQALARALRARMQQAPEGLRILPGGEPAREAPAGVRGVATRA